MFYKSIILLIVSIYGLIKYLRYSKILIGGIADLNRLVYLFAYLFDYTLYPLFGGWIRTVTQEAAFIFFPLVPPLSFLCALGAALLFRALFRLSRRPSRRLNYA